MMNTLFSNIKTRKILGTILILILISFFIPTPYYLYQPGSVEELASKVTVEGGEKQAEGNFYLTTVLSLRASNIYYLAYGLVAPHTDMRKVKEVKGDLTDKEYERMLEHMMTSSQQHALVAGLRAAGEKVIVKPNGVFVSNVSGTSNAKGKIEVGDVIKQVDGKQVNQITDFLSLLKNRSQGNVVELTFIHDGKEKSADIELIPIANGENKAGIGIVPEDQFEIETSRTININAADIGGPSAGLMFSLEVYNQLMKSDITKGYEIAGTGTIDMEGNVGQIGGIREKITAVNKAEMDIFFCPADVSMTDTNEMDVLDEVKKEGYDVKVVPVKTLQEAIDYLNKLPPKQHVE
ncbi:SepM family pheromone-processing serine protease [Lederbergia lenta]|uniref:endopeptidase La n=1 Tax=Lederbergia lenta TaxID=1467 RepID=A0A2X4ZSQ4_LEDLE|nr:SepM family pheromone-processing serine protease [Lederbergia lenta]MCM3112213.1 PDZ domain-containing protein [Lederbergia lenta]MEC2323381.1 SepM family pheromone-processing serine protease [Lederbergia lenta]SQI63334.1 PDZ/DHR/GLGF domain-containing protein [Lederbergia lenta]